MSVERILPMPHLDAEVVVEDGVVRVSAFGRERSHDLRDLLEPAGDDGP